MELRDTAGAGTSQGAIPVLFFLAPFLANQAFSRGKNGPFGIVAEVRLSFSLASV